MGNITQEFIDLKPVGASTVPKPYPGNLRMFLDSSDNQVKTKDHLGAIALYGSGSTGNTGTAVQSYAGSTLLIFDGNSLWQGTGSSHLATSPTDFGAGPFPSVTRLALLNQFSTATLSCFNFGVAGQSTAMMLSDVVSQVDSLFDPSGYDRQIVICGEITNQLANGSGFTAQQAIDNYVQYCQGRRAKGFLVVATTVLPRTAGFTGISANDFETARTFVNNYLRANYLKFADVLADIAAVSGVTYPDGVHPNDAGYLLIGNYVASKVAPLLVTGFNPQSIAFLFTGSTTTPVVSTGSGPTLLVLSGTGPNNSTTIVDSSSYARTVTVVGGAKISTAQSKFGGSSLFFDGTNSYLSVPNSADFDFGMGDFTLEAWMYPTDKGQGFPGLLARGDWTEVQWTWSLTSSSGDGHPDLFIKQSGNYVPQAANGSGSLTLNAWSHMALVSSGGVRKTYTNGVLTGTATSNISMESMDLSKRLCIGILPSAGQPVGSGNFYVGYMHVRITKTALYTAAFTPPASF